MAENETLSGYLGEPVDIHGQKKPENKKLLLAFNWLPTDIYGSFVEAKK